MIHLEVIKHPLCLNINYRSLSFTEKSQTGKGKLLRLFDRLSKELGIFHRKGKGKELGGCLLLRKPEKVFFFIFFSHINNSIISVGKKSLKNVVWDGKIPECYLHFFPVRNRACSIYIDSKKLLFGPVDNFRRYSIGTTVTKARNKIKIGARVIP